MKGNQSQTKAVSAVIPWRLIGLAFLLLAATAAYAQTPVDDDGNPLGPVYSDADGNDAEDGIELLRPTELESLVGPIALYPDDLLAIVLPASTYPLEIVQAARYLEQLESDSSLQPDENWDDSVVALLNYPEVLEMMSDDVDWTWRLGEAVVAQQSDVVAAVESFRDRAYAAGNLKSDERQTVARNDDDVIVIDPVDDDVIYVPYYEPERVVVRQPRRVYHYYDRAYPVYYYPYPAGYHFRSGFFWGVTTAFRIGWSTDHLHVYHHSYRGHPYFGWNYYGNYWRRPSVTIFNNWYGSWGYRNVHDRYRYGSYWRPRYRGGARPGARPGRNHYYSNYRRSYSEDGYADRDRRRDRRREQQRRTVDDKSIGNVRHRAASNEPRLRRQPAAQRQARDENRNSSRRTPARDREQIRFRAREEANANVRQRMAEQRNNPVNRRVTREPGPDNSARAANSRQRVTEARRNFQGSASDRRRLERADHEMRIAPGQREARRNTAARTHNSARQPVTVARRNDANVRRAPERQVQRRRPDTQQYRAPAPRASSPARRSEPAPRNRPAAASRPARPSSNAQRPRAASGERKSASRANRERRR